MAETHAAPAPAAPQGELSIRTLAMPADTNQNGDIFGGWLLSQMDLAGSIFAYKTTQSRNVTVAIDAMTFRKPVFVGDVVSVYASTVRVGRTSITVHVESWVQRRNESNLILVTDGNYTYVAIDDHGHPQPIQQEPPATVV
ncbi:MAG: acyl-CoA thioesterase [Afipia sp.]|jgi:acyl-CoA thioesterase YciA|nr:acyl-CoA thioesterase [Afipia sp.]